MTNKEALAEFKIGCDYCREFRSSSKCSMCENKNAKEALEKQMPKKVIVSVHRVGFCPNCKGSVWQNVHESKYCFRCGQKLYWG